MIDRCFLHFSGVGPRTAERLNMLGYSSWEDCLKNPGELPFGSGRRERFISSVRESRDALERWDLEYLVSRYPVREQWRILGARFSRATFFDIETTGLSISYDHPTVIAAYHRGELLHFTHGRDLDRFLDVIEDSELLVSFNGSSFDVPFLERTFSLPGMGVPHIDLRWVAYHAGYRGGLKKIERDLGIRRPARVADIDGLEAVALYYRWQGGDISAGRRLIAYCRADVVSSYLAAALIIRERGMEAPPGDPGELFARAMEFEM